MFRWFRTSRESDRDEEIQFHIHREVEERMREGMSREDAEAAARRVFGNVDQESMWGWTAVLSLAIGIGANAYLVVPRTREIGIRMAVGASRLRGCG
jgi:hypothetical protein